MKPSTAALALLLCAHLPTTWAQGTCSSDGAPAPRALYERFADEWKDGDSDIPELVTARQRLAALSDTSNSSR